MLAFLSKVERGTDAVILLSVTQRGSIPEFRELFFDNLSLGSACCGLLVTGRQ